MTAPAIDGGTTPVFDDAFFLQLTELFRWRRDVRRFRADPIAPDLLKRLLDMANLAPSVGLSQPWRFITVEDPARRAAIKADFECCNAAALARQDADQMSLYARLKLAGLDEAPGQLAVFAEPDPSQGRRLGRGTMPETISHSSVMAVHTIWLAARAAGLGMGWVSILDPARITEILDVPSHWVFIGYFCLGYPQSDSDTPELERLGWEVDDRSTRPCFGAEMYLRLDRRPSPVGTMLLVTASDGALRALDFADYEARLHRLMQLHYGRYQIVDGAAPATLTGAFTAYFDGDLAALRDVPVATGGTDFQRQVWTALRTIPPGATTSYGALAGRLGRPGASRAVGLANGANPVAIVVPCHRVVGADGTLTGYAGGLDRKRWLLDHEHRYASAG